MKSYSLMLVPASGPVRNFRVKRGTLLSCALAVMVLAGFGGWGIYNVYTAEKLTHALSETEQALALARSNYKQKVIQLQGKIDSEHKKMAIYARTIGQMQARLSRLDALGSRLVEVASLDQSEFDFGLQPAFGGPRQVQPTTLNGGLRLNEGVQYLSARLGQMDTQLAAIEYLLQNKRSEKSAQPHAWPSEGGWLSSTYGLRNDPFTGEVAPHHGVDIANRFGAAVLAASRGVVVFAGKMKDFGYMVDIEHGYGYRSRYGHLSNMAVKVGDVVKDNQLIGRVGSSGRSTGPHLHYEVHRYGKHLNPITFLPRG
ncbi:MAG: M23 family metallopeptidase [Mariprofundaceae bacterium]